MTDIRANLGAQRLGGEKRRHRHRWAPDYTHLSGVRCMVCGEGRDEQKSRRGRTSRNRGNAYERDVAKRLGAVRVGQYGGPEDVRNDWINVQCKNGSAFPERIWSWLEALPHDHRLRAVVIGDAPGAGHRRREVICMDLEDFISWFGK